MLCPRSRLPLCAFGGSHESHPGRVSESSLEARGTCRAADYCRQPGRATGQNSSPLAGLYVIIHRYIELGFRS
jgi:hypothetical protein